MNVNMNTIIEGVTITKTTSIKPDADSEVSKTIHLAVKFDGATIGGVFQKAVSQAVISWANSTGRKKFDTFKNGQTVNVQFTAPSMVDPLDAIIAAAKASNMTTEEYLKAELAKRTATETTTKDEKA